MTSDQDGQQRARISRRKVLGGGAAAGVGLWAAPAITTLGRAAATGSPPPPPNGDRTTLTVNKTGPAAVFSDQEFDFTITVTNAGAVTATNVQLVDVLPTEGSFVSSSPPGVPSGGSLTLALGNLAPGASTVVTVRWKAPSGETTLNNSAMASADNASPASDGHSVPVGTRTAITGAAIAAAGTGLRNRASGDIVIGGIPAGATVTRAVLTWALLYNGPVPSNKIKFNGTQVTADLTATTSGTLCWGDGATIGYAADVTALVSGNGTYEITEPINGTVNASSNPSPVLPTTDGASLFVFYSAPGVNNQILSDFSYSTNTAPGGNNRSFTGITSTGGTATVVMAGPDGQNNFGEVIAITAAGTLNFTNPWDGSDPNSGPDLSIGNLWDTDTFDVSSIMPAGTTSLNISGPAGDDCVGLNAAVLVVQQ